MYSAECTGFGTFLLVTREIRIGMEHKFTIKAGNELKISVLAAVESS